MHCRCFCLILLWLIFPLSGLFAQDVTGLWKGILHNDTTGRNLRYEIAISENKGKLTGYSHTFFIINDKEYYGVKKIKIRRQDNKIITEDIVLIANNYPIPPNKGVRQINILTLDIQDSLMFLSGPFTTTPNKEFNPLTGNIRLQRKNDYYQSALVPHLFELGLTKDLSFVPTPTITETVPENKTTEEIISKPLVKKASAEKKKTTFNETPIAVSPVIPPVVVPAAAVNKRQIETIQSVYFKTDSLVLALYDNGEVDGDTVSVLMNGKVIMPMVGLSTIAVRKTVYITKDMPDSIQLIMYAENLGSIPPNTGLLVVHDGEDVYEIRFSGDLQKNAAIVFKRKR